MNFTRLIEQIKEDEGFRHNPYQDTRGVWTIGYGTTKIGNDPVTKHTAPIPYTEAENHLKADLYTACMDAQRIFPSFYGMTALRQEVLVNMAYNLGGTRLARFTKLNAALLNFDYDKAADEMVDSKWYWQVGNRSRRMVEQMRTGVV